jgi:hypothetical protein
VDGGPRGGMAAAHQMRKIASVRISGETGTAMRFTEPNSFGAANSKTVERSLSAEVARLQKLSLDETLSQSVEEAERLVNTGHYQEPKHCFKTPTPDRGAGARIAFRILAKRANSLIH